MSDLTIVCALWRGTAPLISALSCDVYEPFWVDRLYRGCKRNLARPFRFVCVTDWPGAKFEEPVESVPFAHDDRSYLCLTECLRPSLKIDRGLFMGLDTVIVGSLEDIASYDGDVAFVPYPKDHAILSNPVVAFRGEWGASVHQEWRADPEGVAENNLVFSLDGHKASEQIFWPKLAPTPDLSTDLWPGQIQSWMHEYRSERTPGMHRGWEALVDAPPPRHLARAVYFVAPHRQHNITDPDIKANWI